MEEKVILDAERFFDAGYSCSQAVLGAMSPVVGLESDVGHKAAAAFGGGIAQKKLTCGAVTGAYMALGLMFGSDKSVVYDKTRAFDQAFLGKFDSLDCAKIIESKEEDPSICKKCVVEAVKILHTIK